MPLDPISATAIAAAAKALSSAFTKWATTAGGTAAKLAEKWRNEAILKSLCEHDAIHVRYVKTIWQFSKPVDLDEFFIPPPLVIGPDRLPAPDTVDDLLKFRRPRVLIEGIVGQGKSILMRRMCSRQMYAGNGMPVFLQLRYLGDDVTLKEAISDRVRAMGLEMEQSTLDQLLSLDLLILLLDGFDELTPSRSKRLVRELRDLIQRHRSLRLVVSSRPDSQLVYSPLFEQVALAPLDFAESKELIRHLSLEAGTAQRLIEDLESERAAPIREVLTTPLMVTLLVMKYTAIETLPNKLQEFYQEVFHVLLTQHDATKPGGVRLRKSGLDDAKITSVFKAFCFVLRKNSLTSGFPTMFAERAVEAAELLKLDISGTAFVEDIQQITNLILKDGTRLSFLHKSIQEYYCAAHIEGLREEKHSIECYSSLRSRWHDWRQEIEFLREIDNYRYLKYFLLPECDSILAAIEACDTVHPQLLELSLRASNASFRVPVNETRSYKIEIEESFPPISLGWVVAKNLQGRALFDSLFKRFGSSELNRLMKVGGVDIEVEESENENGERVKTEFANCAMARLLHLPEFYGEETKQICQQALQSITEERARAVKILGDGESGSGNYKF